MAGNSGTLQKWRTYFRTASSNIFEIIEHAIVVAASDCPKEFRLKRDRIAENLFSCKLTRCAGCDRVELALPNDDEVEEEEGCKSEFDREGCEFEVGGSIGSKVNSSRDDQGEMNMHHISNCSYGGEAEALTDEIEQESLIVGEVLRIKAILDNCQDQSEIAIFESLRRLELMTLSVENLKATEIGKSVNAVRKHGSKNIRHLARKLIDRWKVIVDEWVNATAAIAGAEGTPDSVNPSVLDEEEGLPSPPLDEGAFFAHSIELGAFFDGMDDDGNLENCGDFSKNRDNRRKQSLENHNVPRRKQQLPSESSIPPKEKRGDQIKKPEPILKKQTPFVKPTKSSAAEFGPGRPTKVSVEQRVNTEVKFRQKPDKVQIQNRPLASQLLKSRCTDEDDIEIKLEASKRKLHERYQQAANAKKQKTIQVMELHDLPKQRLSHKNPPARPGNPNRHWGNGRY